MSEWINFAELRKQLSFGVVLESYRVELSRKGNTDQYSGQCPLPKHGGKNGKTFSANLSTGLWQCFGCKASGNVIDFAVLMEGCDKRDGKAVRKVAASLRERFARKNEREANSPRETKRPETQPQLPTVINQPLDFALKTLETNHPWFAQHGLTPETVEHFGLGFCKRGSLTGRIAVPLVDDAQQLVAYAGRIVDDAVVTDTNPKYLFPPPREVDGALHVFDPGKFLYNGFRVGKAVKDLIVVQECHFVWSLWQGGFGNVVALMGEQCGDEQAELVNLLTQNNARIWVLTDSSEPSAVCAASVFFKVTPSRLCRWIRVEKEVDIAPDHPLLAALPKR